MSLGHTLYLMFRASGLATQVDFKARLPFRQLAINQSFSGVVADFSGVLETDVKTNIVLLLLSSQSVDAAASPPLQSTYRRSVSRSVQIWYLLLFLLLLYKSYRQKPFQYETNFETEQNTTQQQLQKESHRKQANKKKYTKCKHCKLKW